MIYITDEALTILKIFKKYKGYWFNATAISQHAPDIPKSKIKEILTSFVSNGIIEQDEKYFYRFKENEQKMISAEEVRKYQEEQRRKINITSYMIDIEEMIKENMLKLDNDGIVYVFKKIVFAESLEKIKKVLEDAGYLVQPISPSHYYEFGGISIRWR